MAISSNATGLRPGVCTSSTRPTAPYTGQVIYETDTGYLRVWNGSAWDYFSPKQTLIPGAWQDWTPTVTSATGTITSYTTTAARYGRINNLIYLWVDVTVTNNGTGATALYFTLPVNSRTNYMTAGSWREVARTGTTGVCATLSSGTQFEMRTYNNAYPIGANNDRVIGSLIYEAA